MWISEKTPSGVLKYRMPTVLEAYELLELADISEKTKQIRIKRNFIAGMGFLIDFSDIEIEKGKKVETYEELLTMTEEVIEPLSRIADIVMTKAFKAFAKKK